MRFEALRARHVGPFRDVDVDLAGLPGTLVAIVGPNGAGKTTLLELLAGALFRECPTRGTLASLATARDAMVEVRVVNGAPYTVRQLVDGISGKGETLITNATSAPVLDSAKVSAADKWIAQHLPSPEVLYSSSFAVQGRRGFLDLSASERKQLLVEMLGLQRLERMAEAARQTARERKAQVDVLRARVADLPMVVLAALELRAKEAAEHLDRTAEAARGARTALERARAAAGDAARAAELAEQRRAASGRLEAARDQLAEVEQRIANNQALLGRAAEIHAAVARADELEAELAAARAAQRDAQARLAAAQAEERAARAAAAQASAVAKSAAQAVIRAQSRLADRQLVRSAAGRLVELRAHEAEIETDVRHAKDAIEHFGQLLLAGKDQRIAGLREGLGTLAAEPTGDAPYQSWALNTLSADDERAEQAAKAPDYLAAAKQRQQAAAAALARLGTEITAQERLAARAAEMEAAERDLAAAKEESTAANRAVVDTAATATAASEAARAANEACAATIGPIAAIEASQAALAPTLALRPRFEQAEARVEELTAQVEPLRAAVTRAEAELAALPIVNVPSVDGLGAAHFSVVQAEEAHAAAIEARARADQEVASAQDIVARRKALEEEIRGAETELADWTRLGQDLGRDGLQAAELDASLPELNELCNDLLHDAFGSRFTIAIRTDRLSADGKRMLEGLDITVLDTVNGRDALAETFSGGECVILGEAVSLALTVIACRRAGAERPTIVRDESGAALDSRNAQAYVRMLRRAAAQIGASQVLLVSHSQEVHELCDARLVVSDGQVVLA